MKCFALVGAKKSGKTTLAKRLASSIPAPLMVFDKNREWGARHLPTISEFMQAASNARGRVIVFEDATIFFANTGRSQDLLDILVAARHTRNTTFLLFHSLRAVPLYVLDNLDGIWLLPTRDIDAKVSKRFEDWPHLVEGWRAVQRDGWDGNGRRTKAFPRLFVPL